MFLDLHNNDIINHTKSFNKKKNVHFLSKQHLWQKVGLGLQMCIKAFFFEKRGENIEFPTLIT